ncbi:hypothetical protein P19_0219 [Aeromonas phage P19]|uniref:Uncharacterized protein n=1 Tax=Aeromonas phage vB_AdhaM_G2 TaxID=3238786 RepID=A0AB39TZ25_9CAUD|nr:hypothetical protein P19_0219 [Aeromonas phage P19]
MKRVSLKDPLGHDFIMSAYPCIETMNMNINIVRWFFNNENNIFVEKDPNQTNPQGYIFYEDNKQEPFLYPFSLCVYEWELEKFFDVFC